MATVHTAYITVYLVWFQLIPAFLPLLAFLPQTSEQWPDAPIAFAQIGKAILCLVFYLH